LRKYPWKEGKERTVRITLRERKSCRGGGGKRGVILSSTGGMGKGTGGRGELEEGGEGGVNRFCGGKNTARKKGPGKESPRGGEQGEDWSWKKELCVPE